MAAYMGHVTGPIAGKKEVIPEAGFSFEGSREELVELKKWNRYLAIDSSIGIVGNIFTTLMTCLLSYALLFPQGILPDKYEIAVVQARFFEVSWGVAGRLIFLFVAACFLADTWIATLDAVSRIHTDFVQSFFPKLKKMDFRKCYYFFAVLFTCITSVTMLFNEPGPLILISAVIGFVGTVAFSFAILILNHKKLRELVPEKATPGPLAFAGLLFSAVAYLLLAVLYFGYLFFGMKG